MEYNIEPIYYSARNVAKITGVSERSQRNWRARGFIPPLPDGRHFRADVFDLSKLIVANIAAERFPVASAALYAEICAKAVAVHALCQLEVWDGGPRGGYLDFWRQMAVQAASDRFPESGVMGLMGNVGRPTHAARYFIVFADGSAWPCDDLNDMFRSAGPEELDGPVVVLDLLHLGLALARKGFKFMRIAEDTSRSRSLQRRVRPALRRCAPPCQRGPRPACVRPAPT